MHFSVSWTTRPPRKGESDGVDYRFVDRATFDRMIAAGEFLEWAEVYAHRYGTAAAGVDRRLAAGEDVLLDIDTQGAASVRRLRPEAVLIFILPPGPEVLRDRITGRGQDGQEQVRKRLEAAAREVAAIDIYDYCVVNDSLERALGDLHAIVRARRLRRERGEAALERIVEEFRGSREAAGS